MNKALIGIGSYVAGIITSTLVLEAIGARIIWFAPWLRPEGRTVYKSEYMDLMKKLMELKEETKDHDQT